MKIGIAGPVSTESVTKYLDGDVSSLPQGYGGAPFLGTIIATLIERGHEVSAYTLDRALPPSLKHPIIAAGQKFKIYYSPWRRHSFRPNGWWPGYMLDFFAAERRALMQAIALDRPDVVHAHWTYEFALAAIASNRPYLVTSHDSPVQVLRYVPNAYRLGRYFMARAVFRKAKALTAVSPYLRGEIQRYVRAPITVIPNPIAPALFQQNTLSIPDSRALSKPRIAMTLNGWSGIKNPVPALRAFALLRQRFPETTFHLFGADFGPGEKAQIWTKAHKIEAGMIFHGLTPHEQLLSELRAMHLLLHPSLEESCPMSLVEAMALGLPVVGGNKSGGVPWVLDYGKAGILTDVRSAETICQSLLEILGNKEMYERVMHAGLERVRNVFSADVIISQYEELYRAVL